MILKFRNRSPTHSKDDSNARKPPPAWRKVLYDRDPSVPDNYAPKEFFLAAIERNKNLHKYSFGACVKGSCQVALQVRMGWLSIHWIKRISYYTFLPLKIQHICNHLCIQFKGICSAALGALLHSVGRP